MTGMQDVQRIIIKCKRDSRSGDSPVTDVATDQ